jgi:hypothetical protein
MVGHGQKLGSKKEAPIAATLTHRNVDEAAQAVGAHSVYLFADRGICLKPDFAERPGAAEGFGREDAKEKYAGSSFGGSHYTVMQHVSDRDLERHYLGMITDEAELAPLEEHLLSCSACVERAESSNA